MPTFFGTAVGPALTSLLIDAGIACEDQLIGIAAHFVVASGVVAGGIPRSASTLPTAP